MRIEKPYRVAHTHVQRLEAEPERVFPLLCPVREADWVEGWDPKVVYSDTGLVEADCVFVMPGEPEDVWAVTRYEPERWRIEFAKFTSGELVTHARFALREPEPGVTEVRIAYTLTALSERGRERVDETTEETFRAFMREEWERSMSAYLARGDRTGG